MRVRTSVWRSVFEPFSVGSRPAVHRKGAELDDVVQLVIDRTVDVSVDQLKKFKDCRQCGSRKYWPKYLIGPYAHPTKTDASLFRSNQCFGDGLGRFNLVFVSRPLFHAIKQVGLRGVTFQP